MSFSLILAILGKVPRWVWYLLAAALLYRFALTWHERQVHKTWQSGYDQAHKDDQTAADKLATAARALKKKTDDLNIKMAQAERARYDKDAAASHATAAELRLRQPPRTQPQCAAGRPVPGTSTAPGTVGGPELVPDAGLAEVPWYPLIGRGEQCDDDHHARVAWDRWYAALKGR